MALTRPVSTSLSRCELTHISRGEIDLARARQQHGIYEDVLRSLGVVVSTVAGADEMPDAVFIEDTAVVVEELAVITRPGAVSRRGETDAVEATLSSYRRIVRIVAPGTLDGGDVLQVGRRMWVGLSSRTNAAGVEQLRQALAPLGYEVRGVPMEGCLHLKSAVTDIGEGLVLVNPAWVPADAFEGLERVEIDAREAYAANALRVGETLIFPEHFPRTRERLMARGLEVVTVACDELAKAEGAVTCCSILLESGT